MKTCIYILVLCLIVSVQTIAEENPYISNKNPKLNSKQWEAIDLVNQWIKSNISPGVGENGKVVFPYGTTMPFVIAMPLYPSDIEFEPGEIILDYHLGDSVRWRASPAVSGPKNAQVHHIIIKPVDSGLKSALIVNTNRRSYYIHLISRKSNIMPRIGFSFPEEEKKKWESYFATQKQQKISAHPNIQYGIEDFFFDYTVKGHSSIKPVRVYNNGKKTIIQMSKELGQKEAPSLLVIGPGKKETIVNYRLRGNKYIVDTIFDKAVLLSGVGSHQRKVTITKR
ncbi:MAG: P-type conjugative transfer protein TrbG [Candidatus Margulisbacteria bacterium]|nr:P-type conjugative transfer protein TrbG [Candidatus Margulisiibacteriota bacterium]